MWGVPCRYALASEPILRAVEGLEGVAACGDYSYVRESKTFGTLMKKLRESVKSPIGKKVPFL